MSELRPFSYAILSLVGIGGAGPHDIVRMMRQGQVFWSAAPSHFYSEPKRLEELGYLSSETRPGKTRPRTHYSLTEKGRAALARWVGEPASFPRIQHEAAVKVLSGDIGGDEAVLRSIEGLRADLVEVRAGLVASAEVAKTLPHRERYLRLLLKLGDELVRVHEEWADEFERELGR